jgi:hypothetical protein
MTRAEAEQLIEDCGESREALAALSTHWIGHGQEGMSAEDIQALLYDYVDENALADRVTGPRPDDECDLTNPDRADYSHSQTQRLLDVAAAANLNHEQRTCLIDAVRSTEALGMLDDLQARIGIAGDILAPARAILRDVSAPEDPVYILSDLLRAWQDLQGLPRECADEQRASGAVSSVQRAWLDAYCTLWECTNDR